MAVVYFNGDGASDQKQSRLDSGLYQKMRAARSGVTEMFYIWLSNDSATISCLYFPYRRSYFPIGSTNASFFIKFVDLFLQRLQLVSERELEEYLDFWDCEDYLVWPVSIENVIV